MPDAAHSLAIIGVIVAVQLVLRFLPFLIFRRHTPRAILYLEKVLPYAIMGMLVVYCLKDLSFAAQTHGIPEIAAVLAVILLHKWRHNTMLSVFGGTAFYMILLRILR